MLQRCVQALGVGKESSGVSFHLAGKQVSAPSASQGFSMRSRLPPEKRDNFCSVCDFLPPVLRHPAIPAGGEPTQAGSHPGEW